MKNFWKLLVIVLVAVTGFSMAACSSEEEEGETSFDGTWTGTNLMGDRGVTVVINGDNITITVTNPQKELKGTLDPIEEDSRSRSRSIRLSGEHAGGVSIYLGESTLSITLSSEAARLAIDFTGTFMASDLKK